MRQTEITEITSRSDLINRRLCNTVKGHLIHNTASKMPRQGGQGKGKPRLKDRKYGFGTALLKSQQYGSQGL